MKRSKARRELTRDLVFILIGVVVAIILNKSGFIDNTLDFTGNAEFASFFAGVFFTSAFTIAPASVTLAHIANDTPLLNVALWGALGATVGDLILFFFIRDHFAEHIKNSLKPSLIRRILESFHMGFMKWLSPIIGALIIASPLPDEFGMALLGLSEVRLAILIPIAFVMNIIGIHGIVWFTHIL